MWAYVFRRLVYNIPVYLGILLFMMLALRVQDPVKAYLGKSSSVEQEEALRKNMDLDRPFIVQYADFVGKVVRFDYSAQSWSQPGKSVGDILKTSIPPSLVVTVPTLFLSAMIGVVIALISSYYRGRLPDKVLVFFAVIGMSISYLVYVVFGQFLGAFWPNYADWAIQPFAIQGYENPFGTPNVLGTWVTYCLLPVLIGVIVAMGYDTRFYRAVMVEESGRDYIVTALAKGASKRKVMFVHMLKNAMIPIITRIMSTLPFLITGSILLEMYFNIPGMGKQLITALQSKDFPIIQAFVAVIAGMFILSIILTDILYALVDPRVRLS
ncbi:MAG: peptide/nickel transport system permease protein [Planctomycetota bacterium]|jgi:peptide/nickel transport system permease protein